MVTSHTDKEEKGGGWRADWSKEAKLHAKSKAIWQMHFAAYGYECAPKIPIPIQIPARLFLCVDRIQVHTCAVPPSCHQLSRSHTRPPIIMQLEANRWWRCLIWSHHTTIQYWRPPPDGKLESQVHQFHHPSFSSNREFLRFGCKL